MFSFIKKVVTAVLPWGSHLALLDGDENEREILSKINYMDYFESSTPIAKSSEQPFGQSDPVQYDVQTVKYVHKTGKVTHLCNEFGVIDNVIYFEPSQVSLNLNLKLNDEVLYSAYRLKPNEAERIHKVYALKSDGPEPVLPSESNDFEETDEMTALHRVITGRVTRRRGREVYIESADVWCNLDKIEALFVPVEGDWVELQAVVTVDKEAANLTGDILEVQSLKPLLMKSGFGRITFWSESKREGAIENTIYFIGMSCEDGYLPKLGDEIAYDAVESDQGRFSWRALTVLCCSKSEVRGMAEKKKKNGSCNGAKVDDSPGEQHGISLKPSLCAVKVELNEVKTIILEVTNNGSDRQSLVRVQFTDRKHPQMRLAHSQKHCTYIQPNETVALQFECEGKFLGLSAETVVFHFKNFAVAKTFEISVTGTVEMNRLLECSFGPIIKTFKSKSCATEEEEADVVLYGPRPWTPPKFVAKEKRCVFNIPKKLWGLVTTDSQKMRKEKALLKYAPYLKEDLDFVQYADRFHTLLYMEEMELRLDFKKFDMKEVYLERRDDYLVLEVPGLVEKRPSIVIGDRITLRQPWTEDKKVKQIGYVHDVRKNEVYIKFHGSFHHMYDESECDVYFEPNVSYFYKAHEAVNRAHRFLGEQWLFPSAVNEKPPQIVFDISDEEKALPKNVATFFQQIPNERTSNTRGKNQHLPPLCDVSRVESNMRDALDAPLNERATKTLTWVNKKLNERQKLAVENVLRGQGRPLPYIIFGPPGTGKTITLVEIIIQIYRLMPESRILITTPSNSSADLICERLIEYANFKPGQLVRLLALYRVHEGLVPPKLIPYSTYYEGNDSPKKNRIPRYNRNKIKGSSGSDFIGRHRITVATCSTIGILHYQGLPRGHFSHILVDEAGQTSEPEVLISASFQNVPNGQLILTGDPQQLGPVIFSAVARRFGLGVSLMERLTSRFPYTKDLNGFPRSSGYDPRFITKLNFNYRSVPEILSLPSQMFYNSDLVPTVSQTESEEAAIIEKFNFKQGKRVRPAAIVFHGVVGQNYQERDSPSWFNPHEVWQIVFYVRKLYAVGLKSSDIGIVTPYAKQVQKVRHLLLSLQMSEPKIGSVEEFQGQERYVIILSTVRSSAKYVNSDIAHSLGFVASPQRLNVALTRARALLIIIGNPILLSDDPYWVNVVKYCVKNNSYTGCSVDLASKLDGGEGGKEEKKEEDEEGKEEEEEDEEGKEEEEEDEDDDEDDEEDDKGSQ